MGNSRLICCGFAGAFLVLCVGFVASAQSRGGDEQYGPVVRAYLGYLRDEQEVVDDRVSRHEVSVAYYHRNSNRIRALRQKATQIARESQNDYLPELEAVTADEFGLLFERPPRFGTLRIGEVVQNTFRYLGQVRSGELFYIFARLDPYEQAELTRKTNNNVDNAANSAAPASSSGAKATTRVRRVNNP
ncbi:MAG: hypothetical protein M3R67_03175 [Acidobacteriota bacterium]|nr:hypothetical protein [Acidobacteriota bacterium]